MTDADKNDKSSKIALGILIALILVTLVVAIVLFISVYKKNGTSKGSSPPQTLRMFG